MADTTSASDYRITITKSEKYRVARDGNPDNILGRTAGCRRLMYNRMLNATKTRTNKKRQIHLEYPKLPRIPRQRKRERNIPTRSTKTGLRTSIRRPTTRTPKPRQQPQTLRNTQIRQQKPTRIIPTLQHKHRRKTRRRRHPLA